MQSKKRILFIVPDGVGIKNYLYSKILTVLKENKAQIVIWSSLPRHLFESVEQLHGISIEYKYLKLLAEPFLTRLYREATTYARLHHSAELKNNTSILFNWQKPNGFTKRSWVQRAAQILGNYLKKDYKRILKYETKSKQHWTASIIDQYKADLKDLQPHSCFITHQRVASLMPICLAAKQLNITVNTAIYSWDNLPKARLCVDADYYFVWGEWMQQEMTDYYPEISKDKVKLVGTPQFEFYLDTANEEARTIFAEKHNLDATKNWICFSGDDEHTSPNDPQYLLDLAESVQHRTDLEIIFRRCPVDFSARYDDILTRFSSLIICVDPIWNKMEGNWGNYYPDYKDVGLQYNLAKHCEAVINLGSTMAFDFSIFNKPCLYINYDVKENNARPVKTIYQFQHFQSMRNMEGVVWLNSSKDINKIISQVLDESVALAKDKVQWRNHVVLQPLQKSSKNIAEQLIKNDNN